MVLVGLYSVACLAAAPVDQASKLPIYTPKNGESLDQVIFQTMANSPLKIELLRQAIINLNPNAFEPAKGKTPSLRLRKGVSLRLPDSEQLLQAFVPPKPELASIDQSANSALDGTMERKSWIHFP
jgi:Tfp pilus assembly protein FimV